MAKQNYHTRLKPIQVDDIETIFSIRDSVKENYLSREEIAKLGITPSSVKNMLKNDCMGWIIYAETHDAGFILVNKVEGQILALFIRPSFEGYGFGKLLLKNAEDYLAKHGITEAWLTTPAVPNTRAHKFYQNMGWTQTKELVRNQVRYVKKL